MSILAPIVFAELNHLGRRFTCYICLILIWFFIILISRRHSYRKFKYFIYLTYAESDWAMSMTLRSLTQRCQRFHWVWLSSVIDTKESERFLKMQKTAGKCLSTLEPLHKNALSHEPWVQMSFNHEQNRETVWKLLWNCLFKIMKKLKYINYCWIGGVNDTEKSDYALSLTQLSLTPRCQWHCGVWSMLSMTKLSFLRMLISLRNRNYCLSICKNT